MLQGKFRKYAGIALFGVILGFSHPGQTQAQWYKSYGVNSIDELTKDQCATALEKINKRGIGAIGITAGGGLLLILGGMVQAESCLRRNL